MAVEYGSLKFQEAIDFFRDKINLPTRTWTDIQEGMHARAFVVAGAMQTELLEDFRSAVDKAIADGTTLQEFRKDFNNIVKRHGWSYNGGAGWRSRVIYDTNLRTAYQAGRYKQLTDPDLLKARPYWRYSHSDLVATPREQHLAWDGLVLPYDDPFWKTHYPPNGWGCKCKVYAESRSSLRRKKLNVSESPKIKFKQVKVGNNTFTVAEGIDPGWNYNVGEAAWGKPLSEKAINDYKGEWQPLTFGSPETYDRPALLNAIASNKKIGEKLSDSTATKSALKRLLKADEKVYTLKRDKFQYAINVNAETLGDHIDLSRTPFLPLLPDLLEKPQEAWLSFEQHKQSGKVALRLRLLKLVKLDKDRGMIMVANATRGQLESWTFIPVSRLRELDKQRRGVLVFANDGNE
jgi:hypothetical protein